MLLILLTMQAQSQQSFGIAIHGGAGYMTPENFSDEALAEYKAVMSKALDSGYSVLERGGTAEAAVAAAIVILEDAPQFNAGRGSVLNHDGRVEMDASIMRGRDLAAGAVAGVWHVRNPVLAAEQVMLHSPHVMMAGRGADEFARDRGLRMERRSYFVTDDKKVRLKKAIEQERQELDHHGDGKFGTVGAVALDQYGNLAAATSTGGMTNKRYGRVGDSPIIGAGTYANNRSCAVSCTGHGEYFIRLGVAARVAALMQFQGWDLEKAALFVIHKELKDMGGEGGLIAMDRRGNVVMPFNTLGMFRAFRMSDGRRDLAVFGE